MVCSIAWWSFTKFVQTKVPGSKVAPGQGSKVRTMEMHRNILKNLLLQNHLAQMFEIGMWHCLVHLYQVCSNEGPRVQDGHWPGVPSLSHRNTYKNIYKSSSSEPLGLDA